MRGILKSASGDPIAARQGTRPSFALLETLDGRVEVTLVLDHPTEAEITKLIRDVGRGYYVLSDRPEATP
jgi:hypothetical protein